MATMNPSPPDDEDSGDAAPVSVPFRQISAAALRNLVESFVLREGTDYGEHEYALDDKVAHVMRQLERGEAEVMFDPKTATAGIVVVKRPLRRPRDGE